LDWLLPAETPGVELDRRRARVLVGGAMAGALLCLLFTVHRFADAATGLRLLTPIASGLGLAAIPVLLRVTKRIRPATLPALVLLVVMITADGWYHGGIGAPSFFGALAIPLMATFFLGTTCGVIFGIATATAVTGVYVFGRLGYDTPLPPPSDQMQLMYLIATVSMIGFVTGLAILFERQRKNTEDALVASERRYELALEAAQDGVFEWHPRTDDVYLSAMLAEFLGLEFPPGPHKLSSFRDRVHADDQSVFEVEVPAKLRTRERFQIHFRLRHRSGEFRWLDCRVIVERDDQNRPQRVVGTMRDVSEQRRVSQLKNEFVSSVSHELRTPLTSIRGSLLLLRAGARISDPKARELVEIADSNSQRLLALVDDLLDLQRIEAGAATIRAEQLELQLLVEDAIEHHRPFADEYGVELRHAPTTDFDLFVYSDRTKLAQILGNLLSNAAKFSPRKSEVTVTTSEREGLIRVAVQDRGPGVPADFVDRLFEKFARADGSDDADTPGTGLGLAISKALIEQLGGAIGYEPREAGGSVFWFELAGRAVERPSVPEAARATG
jgi:PAS domain S-box-containing protein